MEQLIHANNIQLLDSVSDWKQAITVASQPLIDGGFIEARYVDAIFKSTEKFGPYYVLAPEIAMPHASCEDGVHKQQIALLVLKKPIKFSEQGFDVRLVFVLATPSNHAHLQMLRQLSEVFADDELIQKIIAQKDADSVAFLLNNLTTKGE